MLNIVKSIIVDRGNRTLDAQDISAKFTSSHIQTLFWTIMGIEPRAPDATCDGADEKKATTSESMYEFLCIKRSDYSRRYLEKWRARSSIFDLNLTSTTATATRRSLAWLLPLHFYLNSYYYCAYEHTAQTHCIIPSLSAIAKHPHQKPESEPAPAPASITTTK